MKVCMLMVSVVRSPFQHGLVIRMDGWPGWQMLIGSIDLNGFETLKKLCFEKVHN